MHRSKLVFHGKSLLDSPRPTTQNLPSTYDTLNHLNTSNSNIDAVVSEALSSKYLLVPSFQPHKRGSGASYTSLPHLRSRQSVHSVPVKESRTPNRKILSGYAKFLIDKEFIEERNQRKKQVQEKIQQSLSIEDTKIMSKDIQMMVSSSIVNSAGKKARSVLRNVDTNSSTRCSVDPSVYKHHAICNRILGNHFENHLLFMQVQSTLNSSCTPKESHHHHEKTSSSQERIKVPRLTRSIDKTPYKSMKNFDRRPITLNSFEDAQIQPRTPAQANTFPPGTIKIIDDVRSLNEIDFQAKNFPQSKQIDSEEDLLNIINKLGKKKEASEEDKADKAPGSRVKISVKKRDNLVVNTAPEIGVATKPSLKTVSTRSMLNTMASFNKLSSATSAKRDSSFNNTKRSEDHEAIEKINKLIKGEKRSTSKLGNRLKKQQIKIVKQFKKLGVEVEKLNYNNTMGNWQKSIKNVDQLEQKSVFFNLIM